MNYLHRTYLTTNVKIARSQLTNVEKHTEELKVLTLEARNHLYAIFRDTEAWQEAMQGMRRLYD